MFFRVAAIVVVLIALTIALQSLGVAPPMRLARFPAAADVAPVVPPLVEAYSCAMDADQQMWTPLESALAPFKELARINRQAVTDAHGRDHQLVLRADRCHVQPARPGASQDSATIELGFTLGPESYAVHFIGADYRRNGVWDLGRLTRDISTGLQSGGLQPGTPFALGGSSQGGPIAG